MHSSNNTEGRLNESIQVYPQKNVDMMIDNMEKQIWYSGVEGIATIENSVLSPMPCLPLETSMNDSPYIVPPGQQLEESDFKLLDFEYGKINFCNWSNQYSKYVSESQIGCRRPLHGDLAVC